MTPLTVQVDELGNRQYQCFTRVIIAANEKLALRDRLGGAMTCEVKCQISRIFYRRYRNSDDGCKSIRKEDVCCNKGVESRTSSKPLGCSYNNIL